LETYSTDKFIYIYIPIHYDKLKFPINIQDKLIYWKKEIEKLFYYKNVSNLVQIIGNQIHFITEGLTPQDLQFIIHKYDAKIHENEAIIS